MKELKGKIEDYTRFGQILLAVSTLLMVGLLIPNGAKETINFCYDGEHRYIFKFIVLFFQRVKVMRDQLEENECE